MTISYNSNPDDQNGITYWDEVNQETERWLSDLTDYCARYFHCVCTEEKRRKYNALIIVVPSLTQTTSNCKNSDLIDILALRLGD